MPIQKMDRYIDKYIEKERNRREGERDKNRNLFLKNRYVMLSVSIEKGAITDHRQTNTRHHAP